METRNVILPVFAFTDTMHLCPTAPRKAILLISTVNKDATVSDRQDKKQDGVSSLYKIIAATHSCLKNTPPPPVSLYFYHLI